jgi:hypothetical protein
MPVRQTAAPGRSHDKTYQAGFCAKSLRDVLSAWVSLDAGTQDYEGKINRYGLASRAR